MTRIETPCPPDALKERLQRIARPDRGFFGELEQQMQTQTEWNAEPEKFLFRGEITSDGFRLVRIRRYSRNEFRPVIRGRYEARGGGSTIHVVMHTPLAGLLFLAICCGVVFFTSDQDWFGYFAMAIVLLFAAVFFYPQALLAESKIRQAVGG